MNRFQWIFIKSPDFNEIKDIKEIRDFLPDFKREPSTVWSTCIKNYIFTK